MCIRDRQSIENGSAYIFVNKELQRVTPVSYTHLDVYKRQADNEEELSPAEVQAAVEDWRDQILAAISQPDQPPYTPWPEDNEKPYYTDKPDWDAFGAMLLVAACHTYEEPVPPTVEKDWDFGEHPLIARLASVSYTHLDVYKRQVYDCTAAVPKHG